MNVDNTTLSAGRSFVVSGALVPAVSGATIQVETTGDFSVAQQTLTNARGEYRTLLQAKAAGKATLLARYPARSVVSRQLSLQVNSYDRTHMSLATNATGEEEQGDQVRIFGQLGAFDPGLQPPEVLLNISQQPLQRKMSAKLYGAQIRQTTTSVPVSADGTFSATVEITFDDGSLHVESSWPGDALNTEAESSPLDLPLGAARPDDEHLHLSPD